MHTKKWINKNQTKKPLGNSVTCTNLLSELMPTER